MISLVWNCRGIGRAVAVRMLRELLRSHRPDVLFLSEIKSSNNTRILNLSTSLGFDNSHFVPSRGKAGGLLLLWKNSINLQLILSTDFIINCLISTNHDGTDIPWQCTFVYGPTLPSLKGLFWDDLNRIGEAFESPWFLVGDFNSVLDQRDKIGGNPVASSSRDGFRNMVDANGLIDLGFVGYTFTWNNRRASKANIQERLDRGFANGDWRCYSLLPKLLISLPFNQITGLYSYLHAHLSPLALNHSGLRLCGPGILPLLLSLRKLGPEIPATLTCPILPPNLKPPNLP